VCHALVFVGMSAIRTGSQTCSRRREHGTRHGWKNPGIVRLGFWIVGDRV